ncbi:MAG TPA: PQQ-binding-like beta-propeller repeat protein [Opitutaceae bacterium]|nr:PQQ-binding-like beta-propeller repeat protein [Opitutaceae bacterium]
MTSSLLRPLLAASCFAALSSLAGAAAANWPTWRGPSGAGVAPDARPPLKWSDTENIKWKTKLPGDGHATPIVWQDRMFVLTAIETNEAPPTAQKTAVADAPQPKGGKRGASKGGGFGGGPASAKVHEWAVIALDRGTGKILWQKIARREVPHEGHHATHGYASGSPVTDGEYLYASFGSRGVYCYDFAGNLKWEKDLGRMRTRMGFGEGASPALAGNLLLVPWDHEDGSSIVALDKRTGAEVWRKGRDEISSWSTPLIVEHEGRSQAVVTASNKTRSYDAKTGELIWEAAGLTGNVIPMPVTGHGRVYVTSGFRGFSIQAIKLSARGDVSETDNIVWSVRHSAPYVPSPVLSGDRLYTIKSNDAFLSCLDAHTGKFHFQDQRLTGLRTIYSSPIAANGYLFVTDREGTAVVLKDGPTFEIVATNKLGDGIDASPVMLGKEIYLRGHEYLYCIAEG